MNATSTTLDDDIMSYRIDPAAALDAETRRIAAEQIDKAVAELSATDANGAAGDRHEAIHDVRKRVKKLRALLRLVRPGNKRFYTAENARLRDIARTLSLVRDRTALIESLDALAGHVPETLAAKSVGPALAAVRKGLERRRQTAVDAEGDLSGKIAATLEGLSDARAALDSLVFPKPVKGAADIAATGYALAYADARDALKRCEKDGTAEDRHALRRHVKYLGFHLALLAPFWPEAFAPMRAAAAAIADDLGRDHDYALLSAELAPDAASQEAELGGDGQAPDTAEPLVPPLASAAHRALVAALVLGRQTELQAVSLAAARRLLAEKPKAARARIRRLYRIAAERAVAEQPAPAVAAA